MFKMLGGKIDVNISRGLNELDEDIAAFFMRRGGDKLSGLMRHR